VEKRFLTPAETAGAIVAAGRRVLAQSAGRTFVLSLLAGFYISFGAQLATVVTSDAAVHVGGGISRLLGGSVFSIGLMLVVVCGAELFTGNSLLAAAVLHGEIGTGKMLENWAVVIVGNLLGALFLAWMLYETRLWENGAVGEQAVRTAAAKCSLSFRVAFVRGVLCNWLVCLAVFMATAARDVAGKILSCYVPIMTFVASGFEHSVANMYFIPAGLFVNGSLDRPEPALSWWNFAAANLLPVTLGNIVGGVLFVASAYWYVHLNPKAPRSTP
jgi:formate/nitrite transporter